MSLSSEPIFDSSLESPLPTLEQEQNALNEVITQKLDPSEGLKGGEQTLAAFGQRDIGQLRQSNQDNFFTLVASLPHDDTELEFGLFVIADGMGGHAGGEIASSLAVRTVAHHVLAHFLLPTLGEEPTEAFQNLMVEAIESANRTILAQARRAGSDMGTTCTAALLLGHTLYLAHVGDSRLYLLKPNELEQLTTDHSAVGRLLELGQIAPEEAHDHPLRSQLYRSVGQQPVVQVDFLYQRLGPATKLLLCSDGLWSMLSDEQIHATLAWGDNPAELCYSLINQANEAGGEDNISVIVVHLPSNERLS